VSAPLLRIFSSKLRSLVVAAADDPRLAFVRRAVPPSLRAQVRELFEKSVHQSVRFHRTGDWVRSDNYVQAVVRPIMQPDLVYPASSGINLHGYFSRWLGLGECARLYAHAMLASHYPVALYDVDIDIPHARLDQTLARHMGAKSPFTRDLIFVNPDHWEETLLSIGNEQGRKHYVIGYWFWELENFPDEWMSSLDHVDEIMVSSAFVEEALRKVSDKPVTRVPMPIVLGNDSGLQRSHFGLADDDYIFFCSFDFNSSIARKNPYAVIEAFRIAFPLGDERVTLLIKTSNGHLHVPALARLLVAVESDARILVRDDMLERHDLHSLHRCVDVYVSLHRCEGFGLGMAEAMRMAKPVVATAYSGNMEFMTEANSCLVDYRLVPVKPGEYPHATGQRWAEPDPSHAAHFFSTLYNDRTLANSMGARAKIDMETGFSVDACMSVLARRLREIDLELLSNAEQYKTAF
jgi:glycosyltransferase involved in cell wall biosynthesis